MRQHKKTFLLFILIQCIFSVVVSASESSSGSDVNEWVLAALPFEFTNSVLADEASKAIAENIPKLILEQISSEAVRIPSAREILNRKRDELRTERLSLFLQLSKAEKTRDAIILQNLSERKLKKAINEQDKIIEDLHTKISENLVENEHAGEIATDDILNEDAFFLAPQGRREFFAANRETVSIYKNDNSGLFNVPAELLSSDFSNYNFEKTVNSAGIKGLISGTITSYGGYVAVTADLHLFPGGTLVTSVTEVGLLSSPLQIARNLARNLSSYIANNPPVVLNIALEPQEAFLNGKVSLDGIVFPEIPKTIVTDRGIHEMTFESNGFRRESITYAFSEKKSYDVSVKMIPETYKDISIKVLNPVPGLFSLNAVNNSSITSENPVATLKVDGRSVIGHFTNEDEISSFFYLPEELLAKNESFSVEILDYDVSENIEKRRRRMYTAYSALIMSLPFTFYNYGTFVNKLNANASGTVDANEVERWRNRSFLCVGITATLGIVSVYQLIRYLASTNEVLPKTVKAENKKK